jgi:uncharacterized protein YkwD
MVRLLAVCVAASALIGGTASAAGATAHSKHRATPHHRRTKRPITHRAPAQCANAGTPATSVPVDAMRAAVVCLINRQRNQRKLPRLNVSSQLNNSAQSWNDVMVTAGVFTHGPGNAFAARMSAAGYNWQYAGENIATGYLTPRTVVIAWMASPDHCRNILDPHFRDVGTGETPSGVADQNSGPATWTQDFGLQMGQSPASSNTGPKNGCPYAVSARR